MRVLITGGAGFIGSALARRLTSTGDEVVIIDNLSTGKRTNVPNRAEFVFGDLADPATLGSIPGAAYDAVVHLAAQSSGALSHKYPYDDLQANVGATVLLSRWCVERSVPRFLFASSMTVYGNSSAEAIPEDTPCRPISYYGVSKLASEHYLRLAASEGLDVGCFRFFNVYGRGQNIANLHQGMVSIYLAYLLDGGPVPVTGSLDRYRDFVHVDDVVDGLARALGTAPRSFRVYNIGTGIKTTVRELLVMLIAALKLPPDHPIEERAGSSSDVFGSVADISCARRELSWRPRVRLSEGLADMVAWARDQQPA
jgi:UDP-glucose 4-epimerase